MLSSRKKVGNYISGGNLFLSFFVHIFNRLLFCFLALGGGGQLHNQHERLRTDSSALYNGSLLDCLLG